VNLEGCGRNRSWPILCHSSICLNGLVTAMKTSVNAVTLPAKIRTQYLSEYEAGALSIEQRRSDSHLFLAQDIGRILQ
jgi:hypothetical protein